MKQQPPQIGHEPLADIVKEAKPLLVVLDPLRYGHTCDENDTTEMMAVMSWLRSYANQGASIVHHIAKSDGSNSRGSSAIRGPPRKPRSLRRSPSSSGPNLDCRRIRCSNEVP